MAMWILGIIEAAAVLLGLVAVVASQFSAFPRGLPLGVWLIGAGLALGGLESLATGKRCFRLTSGADKLYSSPTTRIFGLMTALAGAILIACAYFLVEGTFQRALDYIARRPGPALVAGGLLAVGAGTLMMISLIGHRLVGWTLILRVPWFLLGFVLVVVGIQLIGLGVWELFAPREFDDFVGDLARRLDWRAPQPWWNRLSR